MAKKPRSKRPKKSRSRNVSPPRLGKSAKTDSRSRRGKAPKSSGAVSAPKRSHSKRSDADALLAAKVKQSRTELAELMCDLSADWSLPPTFGRPSFQPAVFYLAFAST